MYEELSDCVLKALNKYSSNQVDALVARQIEKARSHGRMITKAQARDEVIADACERMLADKNAIRKLAVSHLSLAQKIKAKIDSMYETAKAAYGKSKANSIEAKFLESDKNTLAHIRDIWAEALSEAVEASKAFAAEGKKNNTDNGVNMSFRGRTQDGYYEFVSDFSDNLSLAEKKKYLFEYITEQMSGYKARFNANGKIIFAILDRNSAKEILYSTNKKGKPSFESKSEYRAKLDLANDIKTILNMAKFIGTNDEKSSAYTYSVSDLFKLVKQYDKKFNPISANPNLLNADGTPKVFYHGTDASFTVFDKNRINTNEPSGDYIGSGFFFASNESTAHKYGKNIIPVYLSMKTPIVINSEQDAKDFRKTFLGMYDGDDELRNLVGGDYDYFSILEENPSAIKEELQKRRYDGLIDNLYGQYAVFDSNQIKSATDNIGTFNEKNDDIRYSDRDNGDYGFSDFGLAEESNAEPDIESNIKLANIANGLDLVGDSDKTLYAICDGYVGSSAMVTDHSNKTWEWGNYVKLIANNDDEVDDGLLIYYCHMSQRLVNKGDKVKKGDPIGIEGNTGYSFGSHCHFEIRDRDNKVKSIINTPAVTGIPNVRGKYYFQFESEDNLMSKEYDELKAMIDEQSKQIQKLIDADPVYHYTKDIPEWGRPSVQKALDKGIIKGASDSDLNLTLSLVRMYVSMDAAGVF